jgi:hypothetical protein
VPAIRRNSEPSDIDQSVRDSCAMYQNPCAASVGHLVVMIATAMMTSSGTAASRVRSPDQYHAAARYFERGNERPQQFRDWHTNLLKPAGTELIGKQEFLNAFRQKYSAHHETNENGSNRSCCDRDRRGGRIVRSSADWRQRLKARSRYRPRQALGANCLRH